MDEEKKLAETLDDVFKDDIDQQEEPDTGDEPGETAADDPEEELPEIPEFSEADDEEDEELPEMQEFSEEEDLPDISAEPAEDKRKDLYIYDADDETVDDRDLYSDYSVSVQICSPLNAKNATDETADKKAPDIPVSAPESVSDADVPAYNSSYDENFVHSDNMSKTTEKEHHTSGRLSISLINTIISMITLCVSAGGIFTGIAFMRTHDQQIREDHSRMDRLEMQINDLHAEKSDDGDYVDAVRLIEKEEQNEPSVPVDETVDVDRGKIITYDSYVGYSWVPVLPGVKTNSYDKNGFSVDDEYRMSYKADGEVSSYFGIDVSSHQGDIDWNAVRADGVEFAILRIGVRGYGEEGNIRLDEKFIQNYDGARDAGIDIGVYFYSQAISVDEAIEEAKFVLEQLDGRKLEYPVAFDWEPVDSTVDDTPPRTEDVMPGTLNLAARAFCETIEDAGYKAMIYTNKKMAYLKYDLRLFDGYPVWLALYNTDMTYYYDFDIWQYGFARVDGIEGDVDVDIAMIR